MGESSSLCFTDPTVPWCKYFLLISFCQRPSPLSSFHHNLHRRLMFIFWRFLIPSPPCFLLLFIISHLMRWYFLFCQPPCQKKDLLCLSNLSVVDLGRRYIDIWYTNELERLELMRVVLSAMDKDFPFQAASFFSFFSSRRIQSLTCILPGLTGTPRYLMEKVPIWQLNNSAYCIPMLSSPWSIITSL